MRTLILAAIGFAGLLVTVPQWARFEVAVFGIAFGVLTYALDANVRSAVCEMLGLPRRRDDAAGEENATKAREKSPAARRAAT
jgi:hypothetical protein